MNVNHSCWDTKLEEKSGKYFAMCLGFRGIKGIRVDKIEILVYASGDGDGSLTALRDKGVSFATSGKLVQREVDDLPVLTLARGDEKTASYPAQDKPSTVREDVRKATKEAFHGGRNF